MQTNVAFRNCQWLAEEGRRPGFRPPTYTAQRQTREREPWIVVHSSAQPHWVASRLAFLQAPRPRLPGTTAEIVSRKEKAAELRALLVPFAEISAREPGCQKYVLMEVIAEPGRFLTYERWKDKAALDAHMVTKDIKEIVPKLEPILAKPVTQIFLDGRTGV